MNQSIPSTSQCCTSPFPKRTISQRRYAGSTKQGKGWPMRYSWSGLWICYAPRRIGGGCGAWNQQQPHQYSRLPRTTHPYDHTMLPVPIPGPRTPPLPRVHLPILSTSRPRTPSTYVPNVLLPHLWRAWSCGHHLPNRNRGTHPISPSSNG